MVKNIRTKAIRDVRRDLMKAFLLSDNMDTLVGMQMAGIDGVITYNKDDVLLFLNKLKKIKV